MKDTLQKTEQIDARDLSELKAARALLDAGIAAFETSDPEKGWEQVRLAEDFIRSASGARVKLQKKAEEVLKEAPVLAAKDGFALSEIPQEVIRGPSTAEILSHVVERVDRPTRR